jgi:hypothetical protein
MVGGLHRQTGECRVNEKACLIVSGQANADESFIPVEGPICSLRFIPVLKRANFPADDMEAATRDLEYMLYFYSTTLLTPRNSKFAAELKSLSEPANQLLQALRELSVRASQAVGYEAHNLTKPLWAFYAQTTVTLKKIPPDMGGPEAQTKKLNLAFQMALLWRRNFPIKKAITRTSAGDYRGPLLDFVRSLFRLEGVRIQSSNALGKHLYEMRTIIDGKVGAPCSLIDATAQRAKLGN